MYTCKDCIHYQSPKLSRRKRGLGYCQMKGVEVSPYDKKCEHFVRRRVGGR